MELTDFLSARIGAYVYVLVRDGKIMYVGQTIRLQGRIGDHVIEKPPFSGVWYKPVKARERVDVECGFIHKYRPPWNGKDDGGEYSEVLGRLVPSRTISLYDKEGRQADYCQRVICGIRRLEDIVRSEPRHHRLLKQICADIRTAFGTMIHLEQ